MKRKLVQTRIPEAAFDVVARLAATAGVSVAAWVRQLLLKETGVDGTGKKARGR